MFSLRIVNVDHYMCPPKSGLDVTYSQFRGSQIKNVPVFRIFGSTLAGNKACLHVHGVFPYILVPYSGEDDAGRLMYQLASSLDKAINVSQNTSHSTRQHVFKIVQVSGRPFYGYHSQDYQFFKIFFYNPLVVKRACDLLQNGAVCGTKFQIHEGHVPFTLQFFIDYNLYGMSFINLKNVIFRKDGGPPGVAVGSLTKESFCELEADAVAVDILNRLTIEGELAVNPGLAAIWQEEKERLQRDALDESQRPQPPLAMSELLLREKLSGNIKFQGKCKTPLKENIPYPVETQRTTSSDILDASVLDTHSMSSLATTRPNAEEETLVDEELVLSLTQSFSNSLDQSLLLALDNLAAQNEVNTVISQQVEDDSILGSQMLPEQDMFGNDISDGELEALNYSLPSELTSGNLSADENDEESDENFEGNIPQLDGVGDFGGKKRKSKHSKRKRRVLVENSASETYPPSDGEELLLNNIKDDNCWPEPGKQETLEEIFSDEEPYNSPINNFEERCEPLELEPISVDLINSFETVLRGDPSFMSGDLASEDVMFQPIDDNAEDDDSKKISLNEESIYKNAPNIKPLVDQNSNIDAAPLLNSSLDSTDMDKSVMLAIGGEELLNTSQLDEILNEDLNKGLEIICEKSPEQEFKENWIRSGGTSDPSEINEDGSLSDEVLEAIDEMLHSGNLAGSEARLEDIMSDAVCIGTQESVTPLDGLKIEEVLIKSEVNDVFVNENDPQTDIIISPLEEKTSPSADEILSFKDDNRIATSNTIENNIKKISQTRSPRKVSNRKLIVRWIKKVKKKTCTYSNLYEMTKKEIETYYSQLEIVTKYLSQRTDTDKPHPMLWLPIRENMDIEKEYGAKRKKCKSKMTIEKIMKNCKFSKYEILKMKSCRVEVNKLTNSEISHLLGIAMPWSNENQTEKCRNRSKQVNTNNNNKSLKNSSKHTETLVSPAIKLENKISTKENIMQEKPLESLGIVSKKSHNSNNSSPNLNTATVLQCQEKSPKHKKINSKRSLVLKESPLKALHKVPLLQLPKIEKCCIANTLTGVEKNTNTITKKGTSPKKLQNREKGLLKKGKSMVKQQLFSGIENYVNCEKKEEDLHMETNLQDQSTSFKLNKNCVVKLSPISVDTEIKHETSSKGNSRVTLELDERINSVKEKCNLALVSKESKQNEVPEKLNEENNSKLLVEKLVSSCYSSDDLSHKEKTYTGVKTKFSNIKDKLKPLNDKLGDKTCRKRPLRIYSLDGTADNSSSDENIEDKGSSNKLIETTPSYSTPKKQRKSKICRSPRNYIPLSIEIKKSPKVEPKKTSNGEVAPLAFEEVVAEHRNEDVSTEDQDLSSFKKSDSSNCLVKEKLLEPIVSLKRLPSVRDSHPSFSDFIDRNQPKASTSSHPLVKRLKVFVKRLSLDAQGNSMEHEQVTKLKGRFQRSSSLPITSE